MSERFTNLPRTLKEEFLVPLVQQTVWFREAE